MKLMSNWELIIKYNNFNYWKIQQFFDEPNFFVYSKTRQLTLKLLSIKETFGLIECLWNDT